MPTGGSATITLTGLGLVLGTNLGITSDLPTFFRHSDSWLTSIKALTIVQLISIGLGLCSLYFVGILEGNFGIKETVVLAAGNEWLRIALIVFVFFTVISANVANVYSASVGWEVVAPKALVGSREYLILGLGLTTVFILVSNIFSLEFLLEVTDSSLVNLCLVLILGYLISRWKGRLPNAYEQMTYFAAWAVSTVFNVLQYSRVMAGQISPLIVGLLLILVIVFSSFSSCRLAKRP